MADRIKALVQRIVVSNIRLYSFIRNSVYHLSILLPHDSAFYAFKKVGEGKEIFLDIGANDGISARSYRKMISHRPIVSIEPNPHHEASLLRVKNSIANFTFHLIGAGDKNGTMVLYTPIYKGVAMTNYASLDTDAARQNLDRHMNIRNIGSRVEFSKNEISIRKLDELNLNPAIIKIDVEGFEDIVISGLLETIKKFQPMIMVEHNPRSFQVITAMLTSLDYTVNTYDVTADKFIGYSELAPPLNVFFLPKTFKTSGLK